jgi:anhydro-N-acetylmuramic acid kinase
MFFVGVMSGTSCDGVDVVVVDFNDADSSVVKVLAAKTTPYPDTIKQPLLQLIADQPLPISLVSQLDAKLGHFYAAAINDLLRSHAISGDRVTAIGLHGQTVCHQPPNPANPWLANTLQLGSAAITAQTTAITTVANFRQMDVAYGGQGAPLAPVLHQQLFKQTDQIVAVLNLGGIANITLLDGDEVIGFDTGPASCLMDAHIQAQRNLPYDDKGLWAKQGEVDVDLLREMLSDQYFKQVYPKSTGRELFNLNWLKQQLIDHQTHAVDVQRTLLQLTVESIALGIEQSQLDVDQMVVCGGGVHNDFLQQQLRQRIDSKIFSSAELGLDPDFIEAVLMAWLARQNIKQHSMDLACITGSEKPHVYGVRYQP